MNFESDMEFCLNVCVGILDNVVFLANGHQVSLYFQSERLVEHIPSKFAESFSIHLSLSVIILPSYLKTEQWKSMQMIS